MESDLLGVIKGSTQFRITEGTSSWKVNFTNLKTFTNIQRSSDSTTTKISLILGEKKTFVIRVTAEVSSKETANKSSLLKSNQAVITNADILGFYII